jgi:hypothetical protein
MLPSAAPVVTGNLGQFNGLAHGKSNLLIEVGTSSIHNEIAIAEGDKHNVRAFGNL